MTTIDLSKNKKFGKKTINMKGKTENVYLDFENDMSGQVDYYKSGGNIVVKVYAQKQYSFTYTKVFHDNKKVAYGKNKGKYEKYVTVKKGTLSPGGTMSWTTVKSGVTYVSKKGDGKDTVSYKVTLNGKTVYNKSTQPSWSNYLPSLDKSKLLGTYTITNGGLQQSGVNFYLDNAALLSGEWELAANKKGKVTGSNLNETVVSTDRNETFDMKGGSDKITFHNNSQNIGHDTVIVSSNTNLSMTFDKNPFTSATTYRIENNKDFILIDSNNSNNKVTFKNFFNHQNATLKVNGTNIVDKLNSSALSAIRNFAAKPNKNSKLAGTFLNETFIGANKVDKIYTGAGDDTITPNAGNDKIYITGNGTKTINLSNGSGVNTINNSYKADKINLSYTGTEHLLYIKAGNNLIVQGYNGSISSPELTATAVLPNWFKKDVN